MTHLASHPEFYKAASTNAHDKDLKILGAFYDRKTKLVDFFNELDENCEDTTKAALNRLQKFEEEVAKQHLAVRGVSDEEAELMDEQAEEAGWQEQLCGGCGCGWFGGGDDGELSHGDDGEMSTGMRVGYVGVALCVVGMGFHSMCGGGGGGRR